MQRMIRYLNQLVIQSMIYIWSDHTQDEILEQREVSQIVGAVSEPNYFNPSYLRLSILTKK